ncbi:MAG: class I SAM-dependent methyltransferase [Paludibacter sp.]
METRGEKNFIKMPLFAARRYDRLTNNTGVNSSFSKMAGYVAARFTEGRLLDVGTGPGRLLLELQEQVPGMELHGLDISASMLKIARDRLGEVVELKLGNICASGYPDDYFDCVLCSGSFYNWDMPVDGLNEIYRILKPGQKAYLFETTRDYDPEMLNINLQNNLKGYGQFRRLLSIMFLKKQLKMTYSTAEYNQLFLQSKFRDSYSIVRDVLGSLPIYVQIELVK